jgi:hypothetical protein
MPPGPESSRVSATGSAPLISTILVPSADRAMVGRMLSQDAKSSAQAEQYRKSDKTEKAFERWNTVFRNGFPAYG